MIVGTAGHIDHGKTALVRALTGIDADRLPEEKRRGITIELGYASLPVEAGEPIGFVDVPGHEKLVRTMVAGASGIDFALLLVAADDGVMPQTREHLTILSLLGVRRGVAVLTKIDRVDEALLAQREAEVRALLAGADGGAWDVLRVSAVRGDGIDALRGRLLQEAARDQAPHDATDTAAYLATGAAMKTAKNEATTEAESVSAHASHGGADEASPSASLSASPADGAAVAFRMGLDRVFTLGGIGTVVAGSIAAGSVRLGDALCLAHAPQTSYRVRSLQVHGQACTEAHAGQRFAIGLVGLERSAAERGQTLCDPAIAQSSTRLDVWLQVAGSEAGPLRPGTLMHLHLSTQEAMATVAVLGQPAIAPGEAALAQLVLQTPLHAWQGDRFVLRDASAQRTVAGGQVLDAAGPQRYRQTPERLAWLQTQCAASPLERLAGALAHAPSGIDAAQWLRTAGWRAWPFDLAASGAVQGGGGQWLIAPERLAAHEGAVLAALGAFHERWPEDIGPDLLRARRLAAPRMPEGLWMRLVERLVAGGLIGRRGGFLHLAGHGEQLRAADLAVAQKALPLLLAGKFDPPWVRDIAASTGLTEHQVRPVLARLGKTGEAFQVVKDLYYHPRAVQQLAALVRGIAAGDSTVAAGQAVLAASGAKIAAQDSKIAARDAKLPAREGEVTAAAFRDATGLGRKRAIQVLEFFDRSGFLRRVGDVHLLRAGSTLFAGDPTGSSESSGR